MKPLLARCLFVASLVGSLVATPLRAADEGPRLPCAGAPVPEHAEHGMAPTVQAWSGKAAREWQPPACIGWGKAGADMLVAVAGSFRFEGEIDVLLARVGAISAKQGVRYWSTTDKAWRPLVTEAYALGGTDLAQARADFGPAEFTKGKTLYYAQSDNRSSGKTVYREDVLASERERLVVCTENVTLVKMAMFTLFDPGDMRSAYFLERRSPGVWTFYSLTRTRMASRLLPTGSEASYINRAVALFRHIAAIPTDQDPPAAR